MQRSDPARRCTGVRGSHHENLSVSGTLGSGCFGFGAQVPWYHVHAVRARRMHYARRYTPQLLLPESGVRIHHRKRSRAHERVIVPILFPICIHEVSGTPSRGHVRGAGRQLSGAAVDARATAARGNDREATKLPLAGR
jgi:hypothetical protein